MTHPRNTICLWFNGQAEEAAQFYTSIFPPDSSVAGYCAHPGGLSRRIQGGRHLNG